MKKILSVKVLSLILVIMMLLSALSVNVFAANSSDVDIIKEVSVYGVHTPYAGECPDYTGKLASSAYTYDDQFADDPEVVDGKWWYDETARAVVSPEDTFVKGHIYTFTIMLVANDGYEFRVDNYNTPFISATVNGETAVVVDDLTGKKRAFVEFTFEPCDYNYEISEVEVNVEEPVAGGYPSYDVEILTGGVVGDESDSPYYIESVAWYDCVNQTFLDPSHTFKEDGIYEVNIVLTTIGDYYFATENDKAEVNAIINGKEGISETAGKNDKYHIRVARVVYGDIREEVSYVEVTGVTEPTVGSTPDFDVTPANDKFYINGVFWTDVTESTEVNLKAGDTFKAGHTYELQIWIRANENYKFSTDEDGYIDIMALVGGLQADVIVPGSEISAELFVRYTLSADNVISFVEVVDVVAPVAGNNPVYDAFCTTQGCNVSKVEWYDVTEGRGILMNEEDAFEAGRKYEAVVRVDAEGNHVFEVDDIGANIAEGTINGERADAYSSYDDTYLELGYTFAPCAENPTNPSEPVYVGILGDANEDSNVNIKDATAIQKHIAGLALLTETGVKLADVDASTIVNIKDATAIQKHIAGLDTGFDIDKEI